ncbi:MAG: penicillin-binding transpeptidase domain-containing protein [Chitinophagaceae bacterium]
MRFFLIVAFAPLFFSCTPNNVTEEESVGKYFTEAGATGSLAVLDNGTGEFTIYNLDRYRDSAYLPAGTFTIVASLVGLQTGRISNDSMVIPWDGITRGQAACNGNASMYTAFRSSCTGWYRELARRIGKDTMQQWIDTLAYGTKKIQVLDSFWLDNSLKVKPDEQLGLIKKLYFTSLPFHKINQDMVKKAMVREVNTNYTLSYQDGEGINERGNQVGWSVGYIEENKHPYFFVLSIETPGKQGMTAETNLRVLKNALGGLGFMQGKR